MLQQLSTSWVLKHLDKFVAKIFNAKLYALPARNFGYMYVSRETLVNTPKSYKKPRCCTQAVHCSSALQYIYSAGIGSIAGNTLLYSTSE